MSLLASFEKASKQGQKLPWLLVNCPSGDLRAVLAKAFAEEKNTLILSRFILKRCHPREFYPYPYCRCAGQKTRRKKVCERCCEEMRKHFEVG